MEKKEEWLNVDEHTPESRRKEGSVLPVKVLYVDGTIGICGWCNNSYYSYDGPIIAITHFSFIY